MEQEAVRETLHRKQIKFPNFSCLMRIFLGNNTLYYRELFRQDRYEYIDLAGGSYEMHQFSHFWKMYLASRSCWRLSLSNNVFDLKSLDVLVNTPGNHNNTKAEAMARIFNGNKQNLLPLWWKYIQCIGVVKTRQLERFQSKLYKACPPFY